MIIARIVRLTVVSLLFVCSSVNLWALDQPSPVDVKNSDSSVKITPLQKKIKKKANRSIAIDLPYFFIERPAVSIGGSYEDNIERQTSFGELKEDTVVEYREYLGIQTRGWLYHPALLDFTINFTPEWIQTDGEKKYLKSDEDPGYLSTYSFGANLLPLKPYTLNLYGTKHQNSFRNVFNERAVINTESKGARLHFKYKLLPTSLSYTNTEIERRASLVSSQNQEVYDLGMANQTQKSLTQLNVNYREIQQYTSGERATTKSSDSYLRNTYFLDHKREKRIFSDFIYNWIDGKNSYEEVIYFFRSTNLKWSEELYWNHLENLWTNYKLSYQSQEIEDFNINTQFAGISLNHLLYENLTTTIEGEASRNEYEGATDDMFKGKINLDYTRDIPWGVVNVNSGFDGVLNAKNSGNEWFWVLNEPYTVFSGSAIFLQQENVDVSSIRVTNVSGSVLYILEQDYTIEQVGTLIRIRPTFVGNINEKDGLFISYRYANTSNYEDVITGRSFGASVFLWSTFRLSYDYYAQKQRVTGGVSPANLVDDNLYKAQARIFLKWTETTFTYENYDSHLESARKSWSLNERVTFSPGKGIQFNCSGWFGETEYEFTEETEEAFRVAANVTWFPLNNCRTGGEVYQYGVSGAVQDESNGGALVFIDVFYGGWTGSVSLRYLSYEDGLAEYDRTRQSILFRITREIW